MRKWLLDLDEVRFFLSRFETKLVQNYERINLVAGISLHSCLIEYEDSVKFLRPKIIDRLLKMPITVIFCLFGILWLLDTSAKALGYSNSWIPFSVFAGLLVVCGVFVSKRQKQKDKAQKNIDSNEPILWKFVENCRIVTRLPWIKDGIKFDEWTIRMNLLEEMRNFISARVQVDRVMSDLELETQNVLDQSEKIEQAYGLIFESSKKLGSILESSKKFGLEFDMEEIHAQALPLNETSLTAGSSQATYR